MFAMNHHRRAGLGRAIPLGALVVAVVLTQAGCATTIAGTARPAGAPLAAPAPVNWGRATPPAMSPGARSAPRSRSRSTTPTRRRPGQPGADPVPGHRCQDRLAGHQPGRSGESGVDAAASIVETLPAEVRQRFDLVGFDPRGVGSSTPAVWCNSDADNDASRADPQVDYSQAGIDRIETTEKQYVQRCVDKMGKEFLANVGTANVARDLDRLRAALGDDKLTYLGYSYGTAIGAAYARLTRTRSAR